MCVSAVAVISYFDLIELSSIKSKRLNKYFFEYANLRTLKQTSDEISLESLNPLFITNVTHVHVVNLTAYILNETYDCYSNGWIPKIKMCTFPEWRDVLASKQIAESGLWEIENTQEFIGILSRYRNFDLIDVGASLGQYSLLASGMLRRVLAVEPNPAAMKRLVKSFKMSSLDKDFVLVTDAISNQRSPTRLRMWKNSQSNTMVDIGNFSDCADRSPCHITVDGILMNDLVPVIDTLLPNMSNVLLKLDIEGHEHRALLKSSQLFKRLNVAFIMMEWVGIKHILLGKMGSKEDIMMIQNMVETLKRRGYDHFQMHRRSLVSKQMRLTDSMWEIWPDEVLWIHRNYTPAF